jgi:phosphoribosylformimino-5-aminoimidazole carboxamide ribotide isomerase
VQAIPAIELKGGCAVRLDTSSGRDVYVNIGDPRDTARRWMGHGFQRLHVVDLDAASGRGSNSRLVRDLLWDGAVPIQVGGGIASTASATTLFDDGAEWVVVGSRAIEDPDWLIRLVDANTGGVILALDVLQRRLRLKEPREWGRDFPVAVLDFVDDLSRTNLSLAGLLVTSAERVGQFHGSDLPLMEDIAEVSAWPVLAAGGIATIGDLRALEDRGVAGAVIGMALYAGTLDPDAVAEEFPA